MARLGVLAVQHLSPEGDLRGQRRTQVRRKVTKPRQAMSPRAVDRVDKALSTLLAAPLFQPPLGHRREVVNVARGIRRIRAMVRRSEIR